MLCYNFSNKISAIAPLITSQTFFQEIVIKTGVLFLVQGKLIILIIQGL